MLSKHRPVISPGEILNEEFLILKGVPQRVLAAHLGWSRAKVNGIIHGRRGISAGDALSLADALRTTAELWLNLQKNYDLSKARRTHKKKPSLTETIEKTEDRMDLREAKKALRDIKKHGTVPFEKVFPGKQVDYEHHGWKFHEVDTKMKKEIDKKAKAIESGKVKSHRWKGSIDSL